MSYRKIQDRVVLKREHQVSQIRVGSDGMFTEQSWWEHIRGLTAKDGARNDGRVQLPWDLEGM